MLINKNNLIMLHVYIDLLRIIDTLFKTLE